MHHVDELEPAVARAGTYEATHTPDVTDAAALAATDVTPDHVAIVLTERDSRTLLATQLLRTTFDVERVRAVLTDPQTRDAFDIPGVTAVCGAGALADAVLETPVRVESPQHSSALEAHATTHPQRTE